MTGALFHYACHVDDLGRADDFYGNVLGCPRGRSTETWADYNFFGHQLSLHLGKVVTTEFTGNVAGTPVPMPHFGAVLPFARWREVADRLAAHNATFVLPPTLRFEGEPGEQGTLFVTDPAGNAIELKGFRDMAGLYATTIDR